MNGSDMERGAALQRAIRATPIIDNHAHPLLRPSALAKYPLLTVATEAHGDALGDCVTGLAHFRAVKQLARVLGCGDTWEDVAAAIKTRQAGDYDAWIERCLEGIETVLVDDGLDGQDEVEPFDFFDKFTPSRNKRIVRIEQFLPAIMETMILEHDEPEHALDEVIVSFEKNIRDAISDDDVVGFKSVICYRTGLAIPRTVPYEEALKAFAKVYFSRRLPGAASFKRLNHRPLNEYFVHRLASLIVQTEAGHKKPIQFHTGLGDNDITLTTSSPSHMQDFIREYPTVPIVLLHASYPYTREAGYLAAMYANVYADIGEVFPFLSRDGQESVVRQILELCPGSKILWSTDGHWFPETYILAVDQMREVLGNVLQDYVRKEDMTQAQAIKLVQDVLFNNSNKLYDLGLTLKPLSLPSPIASDPSNADILARFSQQHGKDKPRFLRVCWSDMTGSYRMRAVPMRRVIQMLNDGEELSFGVTKAALAILPNDMIPEGASPVGEYRLHPDMSSLRVGPRSGHLAVMVNFREEDGSAAALCPRTVLQRILKTAAGHGLEFTIGFEIELILVRRVEAGFAPLDGHGHAWGVSRAMEHDAALTVIDNAVEQLEAAEIYIEMLHPESASGQFEFVLPRASPVQAVDTLLHARDVISSCATAAGYRMTLHPKPFSTQAGTAAHVHMSISSPGGSSPEIYEPFYAGILTHFRAICAFTYSNPTSYERVQDGCWAGGTWVAWGTQNREAPLRRIAGSHWEVKSMDGLANPYLALAALLAAGTQGVARGRVLRWRDCAHDPSQLEPAEREALGIRQRLPRSLPEAMRALAEDAELRSLMGEELVQRYSLVKKAELQLWGDMGEGDRTRWIMERY